MPITAPFDRFTDRYEEWFEAHEATYRSEIHAISESLPTAGRGVEIGVGSGRFAGPLGIEYGVDPSRAMLAKARERGVVPVEGVAESLPFRDDAFDAALVVTTICFVDDAGAMASEARRVLRDDGRLVIGFVDRESYLGQRYQDQQDENPFYRDATFFSVEEVIDLLEAAGFADLAFAQTVFHDPGEVDDPEPVRPGYGDGSFVVVAATA